MGSKVGTRLGVAIGLSVLAACAVMAQGFGPSQGSTGGVSSAQLDARAPAPTTSGYVLTSNGPGVAPTYQAAGGGLPIQTAGEGSGYPIKLGGDDAIQVGNNNTTYIYEDSGDKLTIVSAGALVIESPTINATSAGNLSATGDFSAANFTPWVSTACAHSWDADADVEEVCYSRRVGDTVEVDLLIRVIDGAGNDAPPATALTITSIGSYVPDEAKMTPFQSGVQHGSGRGWLFTGATVRPDIWISYVFGTDNWQVLYGTASSSSVTNTAPNTLGVGHQIHLSFSFPVQ